MKNRQEAGIQSKITPNPRRNKDPDIEIDFDHTSTILGSFPVEPSAIAHHKNHYHLRQTQQGLYHLS